MNSAFYITSTFVFVLLLVLFLNFNGSFGVSPVMKCYSPNGKLAASDFPCFLAQDTSACCGAGGVCLSNGLCEPVNAVGVSEIIRGTCTDPTWTSSSCPQYCTGKFPLFIPTRQEAQLIGNS